MALPQNLSQQLSQVIWITLVVIGIQTEGTGARFLSFFPLSVAEPCEKIPREIGQSMHSTAGIFVKKSSGNENEQQNNLELVLSGVIVSSNSIITLLKLSSDGEKFVDEDGKTLSKLFVMTGINLTDSNGKSVTQITEVDAVIPFFDSPSELTYVPAFLHLKKRLNLKTPQIKAVCLPLKGFFHSLEDIQLKLESERFTLRGYADSKAVKRQDPVWFVQILLPVSREECGKRFGGGDGVGNIHLLYCGTPVTDATRGVCATHGSADIFQHDGRGFLKGLTVSVPGKTCTREDTLFFYNLMSTDDDLQTFLSNSIKCLTRNKISCPSGECLDLNKICNKVGDCSDGLNFDEHPAICSILNPGNFTEDMAKVSKMSVIKSAVPISVRQLVLKAGIMNERKICPVPQYPTGVESRCSKNGNQIDCNRVGEGTRMELTCKLYYQPKTRISRHVMTCKSDGTWAHFKAFSCKAECGRIDFNPLEPLISGGVSVNNKFAFPWFAALFTWESSTNKFEYSCGGSLIENSVVVTAAHCVSSGTGRRPDPKNFRIVLAPTSSIFEHNKDVDGSKILEVRAIWVPRTFDVYSYLSDIALIQIHEPVQYDANIQPICYLEGNADWIPSVGSTGKIAGFGKDETKKISAELKFASLPVVSNSECKDSLGISIKSSEFCAGFRNGSATCEGDSGGGIVFKLDSRSSRSPYVLKGIVSRGLATETGACLVNAVTVFTHLDAHGAWVLDVLKSNNLF